MDALRGIAVGGILLANVFVFFGLIFRPPDMGAFPTERFDHWVEFLEHVLVEGKFYSIFSLLFGIGFGLQLARGGDAAIPRFKRRLWILLAIGAVHAFLIWAGDILMLYAMLGFFMPWFARRSDRQLLNWTIGLLATPTLLHLIATIVWAFVGSGPATEGSNAPPPDILKLIAAMGTGGLGDALIGNLVFVVGRWFDLFVTVRFPKVLGMFVLGLWVLRQGIPANPRGHEGLLRRWRLWGLAIGLPANIFATIIFATAPYLPPTPLSLLAVALQGIGIPLLAIGYAATVALAMMNGLQVLNLFVPVGRMALTNYLTHSIVCVTLAYGFGLGLFWRVGALYTWFIAFAVLMAQIPFSRWWLSRYQYGPAEWIWRRLTYRERLPMRRAS